MSKKATKSPDNVWYLARMEACRYNDTLSSREGAAQLLGIDRTRLARMETDSLSPYPEEVRLMAEAYNAPELNSHYCAQVCPIGKGSMPDVEILTLDRLTIQILATLRDAEFIKSTLLDVVKDGVVNDEERPKIEQILEALTAISKTATEMRLWVEKFIK